MATRSFLSEEELESAKKYFEGFLLAHFNKSQFIQKTQEISDFLCDRLYQKLSSHPLWKPSRPVALGSWARDEVCAKSDIDMLFAGEESVVLKMTTDLQESGIKLRYRVPLNSKNWAEGVEAFDIIALLRAKAFYAEDRELLARQQQKIIDQKKFKILFKAMQKERRARELRYDSVANYLEPNIKYGPGGLRDLDQGLMMQFLYRNKLLNDDPAIIRLHDLKSHLLIIRHWLHCHGYQDILVADAQKEIAARFGFQSSRDLMTHVQKILSEVSFYTDWIAEKVLVRSDEELNLKNSNPTLILKQLKIKPTVLKQEQIRRANTDIKPSAQVGKTFYAHLSRSVEDKFIIALFRSRLFYKVFHDLARVEGLVQHDQYHKLSVDAHTQQAMREVLRVFKRPKKLGALSKFIKQLSDNDFKILIWTALFHDLGKGLAGDHSSEGELIVRRELQSLRLPKEFVDEVSWMVKNHLILSGASFRQNPKSPATWQKLFDRGVIGERILRLTIFTAIDIIATNPEAWTPWKEKLLYDLATSLLSPVASKVEKLKTKARKEFITSLDPIVLDEISKKNLESDLRYLHSYKSSLPPLIINGRKKGEVWIRFHERADQPGLFLKFVGALHAMGLNILEAFAVTDKTYGAYDWFRVKSQKSKSTLQALLKESLFNESLGGLAPEVSKIKFQSIEIISQDQGQIIISFRGKDQRGALYTATKSLYENGFSIQSARVNTWGDQIDDVFEVTGPSQNVTQISAELLNKG